MIIKEYISVHGAEIMFVLVAMFCRFISEALRFTSSTYHTDSAKEASKCWVNYKSRIRKVKKC